MINRTILGYTNHPRPSRRRRHGGGVLRRELMDKCTWTWTTRGGKNGSCVTGPNGNSIFLSATGPNAGGNHSSGAYWSSSLYTDSPYCAYLLYFGSGYVNIAGYERCWGPSVRPVSSPQK